MSEFIGFPARMEYTPVPNIFLSNLLPEITDIAELRVMLHAFRLLYFKKGFPQYISFQELANDAGLTAGLKDIGDNIENTLGQALSSAAGQNGKQEDVYLLNTEANREAVEKILNGELRLPVITAKRLIPEALMEKPENIFTMYEENIGLLTPMIAEELRDAEKTYPMVWIKDAIKEAVNAGKRNWRYISAILERWETEGKSDGTHLRDFKKTDPDKFIKGKYGHAVKR
jgi:DnaD/phage-associated family protein